MVEDADNAAHVSSRTSGFLIRQGAVSGATALRPCPRGFGPTRGGAGSPLTSELALVLALVVALALPPRLGNPGSGPVLTNVGATTSGRAASRATPTPTRKIAATTITTPKNSTGVPRKTCTSLSHIKVNARRIAAGRNLATCTGGSVSRRSEKFPRARAFSKLPPAKLRARL